MRYFARSQGLSAIIGVVIMLLAFSIVDFRGWWTANTMSSVLNFTSILGFLAIGEALVIMTGEIDLSVGSVYGLAGVTFIILGATAGVPAATVAALAIAALVGFMQGLTVVRGKIPSMIVTLGGLFTARGIVYVWTGGSVRAFPEEARNHWLTQVFGGSLFSIDASILWLLLILALLSLMMLRTRFGNRLLATGGNIASAESRGVRTDRVKIAVFTLSSLLAGFAAILTLSNDPQTHVTLGELMELEAISAAVIGGCLLSGGRGSLLGAVLGALIVVSFRYELIALGAPSAWYQSFVGAVLIIAVIANQNLARWAATKT
jgi:simple sugar transport system permease protein/ribose transport system permease protein